MIPKPDFPKFGWQCFCLWLETAPRFGRGGGLVSHRGSAHANEGDSEPAPDLLREVPADVRFILDDRHDNAPELCENCEQSDRLPVTTKSGRSLHTDDAACTSCIPVPMSNIMHISQASLTAMDRSPTFGLIATQRFADGGQAWSTNWLYGVGSRTALICVSSSRLFSKRPESL